MLDVTIERRRGYAHARVIEDAGCARCRDGMVEVVVGGVARWGRCRCRRVHDAAAVWNLAAVPASHAEARLMPAPDRGPAAIAHRSVVAWLQSLGEGAGGGIYLYGPPGTGKTWLAVAALHALTFRRAWPRPARFLEIDRFVADHKARFNRDGQDGDLPSLERLGTVDVLVLDDLNGTGSEFDRRLADDLVARRAAHDGVTIITSNRSPDELGRFFSDRLTSRLIGLCRLVAVQGPDRRRPGGRAPPGAAP